MATAIGDLKKFIYKSVSMGLLESELVRRSAKSVAAGTVTNPLSTYVGLVEWTAGSSDKSNESDYITQLCAMMKDLWAGLQKRYASGESFPKHLLEAVWDLLGESLFDLLLDAFVRVEDCPIQGRSRMIADLEALSLQLSKVNALGELGKSSEDRARRFLKAFYYERESDVLDWIRKNQRQYHQDHLDCLRSSVGS